MRKKIPWPIELVVFDFDGVMTTNQVFVFDDGGEAVLCNRSDGLGISLLKKYKIPILVLTSDCSHVALARCQKLGIECINNINSKLEVLTEFIEKNRIDMKHVIYVGNDINDIDCLKVAGYRVLVADAHSDVIKYADFVLNKKGGEGAVRELCDLIVEKCKTQENAICHAKL